MNFQAVRASVRGSRALRGGERQVSRVCLTKVALWNWIGNFHFLKDIYIYIQTCFFVSLSIIILFQSW